MAPGFLLWLQALVVRILHALHTPGLAGDCGSPIQTCPASPAHVRWGCALDSQVSAVACLGVTSGSPSLGEELALGAPGHIPLRTEGLEISVLNTLKPESLG